MWFKAGALLLALVALAYANTTSSTSPGTPVSTQRKVLCYYEGSTALREGLGKSIVADIEPALPLCTHLIYGYAGINADNYNVRSLNEALDLDSGKGQFRAVTTELKRRFPTLKVLLGVGFFKDPTDEKTADKYLTLLESGGSRTAFINSLYGLVKSYNFDGADIAWQFRQTKPKKIRGLGGSIWHGFKKVFTGDSVLDPKADEHKEEFTALVRDLKSAFLHEKFLLGLTVLPHVNESLFLDIPLLKDSLDYVNLASFDQQTPDRNPKEGDFTAPIYEPTERVVGNNIDAEAKYWLAQGTPAEKIVIGIPAYGRGWKLTEDSGITGVPPIPADGPSLPGQYTGYPGFYSWAEVCALLPNPGNANLGGADQPLRKIGDPTKRFGVYAFRIPDENNEHGMWLSYEDPDSSGNKAAYVKAKGLGGISIFELGYDDFRGSCAGDKFPILRAAKYRL